MDFSKKTILIVDDESDILEFISYNLNKEGFNVHSAKSGNEALGIISDIIPDLVLLDVMLPGINGFEVCQKIKNAPETSHIPVIFLTAKKTREDEERGHDVGAAAYITKPFKSAMVMGTIEKLLQND